MNRELTPLEAKCLYWHYRAKALAARECANATPWPAGMAVFDVAVVNYNMAANAVRKVVPTVGAYGP